MDVLHITEATGWRANWLNGWLAAIGAAVLVDGLRVSWSDEAVPHARLHTVSSEAAATLYNALPTLEHLETLSIARQIPGRRDLPRNFGFDVVTDRAEVERAQDTTWLGACVTDTVRPLAFRKGNVEHSPFDVSVPKGITLHQRIVTCREAVSDEAQVAASLAGRPTLDEQNGLGFDCRRIEAAANASGKLLVDPVVEVLAAHALMLFPVRVHRGRPRARAWRGRATRPGSFVWRPWTQPLDRWGIDALLDRDLVGLGGGWEVVPYQPAGSADSTRAYASRSVRRDR